MNKQFFGYVLGLYGRGSLNNTVYQNPDAKEFFLRKELNPHAPEFFPWAPSSERINITDKLLGSLPRMDPVGAVPGTVAAASAEVLSVTEELLAHGGWPNESWA